MTGNCELFESHILAVGAMSSAAAWKLLSMEDRPLVCLHFRSRADLQNTVDLEKHLVPITSGHNQLHDLLSWVSLLLRACVWHNWMYNSDTFSRISRKRDNTTLSDRHHSIPCSIRSSTTLPASRSPSQCSNKSSNTK